jgi:putative endonuclease
VRSRSATGLEGEALVAAYLEERGFGILARNARVGRFEIDLVARRLDLLVFCEVRARRSSAFLDPIETIDRAKTARVRRAAAQWLALNPQGRPQIRFDAASVLFDRDPPQVSYYEAAF